MTPLFACLEAHTGIKLPVSREKTDACTSKKSLKQWIDQQDKNAFNRLAERASLWRFQHSAQCAQINSLLKEKTKPEPKILLCVLEETLWMAALLEALHLRLNEKRAAEHFRKEQLELYKALQTYVAKDLETESPHASEDFSEYLEQFHQWFTYNFDSTRLFMGHIRRICATLVAAPERFGYGYFGAELYAQTMGPLLTFASFLVYLPRTISNIIVMLERMLDNNHHIDFWSRLAAHCELHDRLFNLVNDAPSVIAAVIGIFILSGASLALIPYITVAVKVAEVIFASTRAYFEVARFDALRAQYNHITIKTQADEAYITQLDACIANEKDRFIACAAMHGLLLFCLTAFIPPIAALSPWVTVIAAVSAMLVLCLRFPEFRDLWVSERPNDSLKHLSKNSFFQPAKEPQETHTEPNPIEKTPTLDFFNLYGLI